MKKLDDKNIGHLATIVFSQIDWDNYNRAPDNNKKNDPNLVRDYFATLNNDSPVSTGDADHILTSVVGLVKEEGYELNKDDVKRKIRNYYSRFA